MAGTEANKTEVVGTDINAASEETGAVAAETVIANEMDMKARFGSDLTVNGVIMLETAAGTVGIFNTNLVGPKVIDIIRWWFDTQAEGFVGVYNIIFRADGYPEADDESDMPTCWMYFPDMLGAVCNIKGCMETAPAEVLIGEVEEASCMNSWLVIWRAIIQGFFHEMHHGKSFVEKRDLLDTKGQKGSEARANEEAAAREYAQLTMIEAGKTIDVEPAFTPEMAEVISGYLKEQMTLVEVDEDATERAKKWVSNMRYMEKHGFLVHLKGDDNAADASYTTFKEFLHACSGDPEDDAAWVGNTTNTIAQTTPLQAQPAAQAEAAGPTGGYVIADHQAGAVEGAQDYGYEEDYGIDEDIRANDYVPTTGINPGTPAQQPAQPVQTQTTAPQNPVQGLPQSYGPEAYQQTSPTQQAAPQGPTLAPLNVPHEQLQAAVVGLYQKLAWFIFNRGGYQVGQTADVPFFHNVQHGIAEQVPLEGVQQQLVVSFATNAGGKYQPKVDQVGGFLTGLTIDKAGRMPGYDITMNDGQGNAVRRKFVPQNPWGPSGTATMARNGEHIVWIIDPADDSKPQKMRVRNGVVEVGSGSNWTAVNA